MSREAVLRPVSEIHRNSQIVGPPVAPPTVHGTSQSSPTTPTEFSSVEGDNAPHPAGLTASGGSEPKEPRASALPDKGQEALANERMGGDPPPELIGFCGPQKPKT